MASVPCSTGWPVLVHYLGMRASLRDLALVPFLIGGKVSGTIPAHLKRNATESGFSGKTGFGQLQAPWT